ncbi:MAG TPA: polysaccharide export protein [Candidatus Macondimonas sp.]|nr:polysaccharide export protein [Candidatus Macondimonas sp.]
MTESGIFMRLGLMVLLGILAGCGSVPGIVVDDPNTPQRGWAPDFLDPLLTSPSAQAEQAELEEVDGQVAPRIIPVTPALLREQAMSRQVFDQGLGGLLGGNQPTPYRIGPQDILNVLVWDHPELSNPMGNFQDIQSMGRLVREDGTIFFPYAGVVQVAGKTVEEIRRDLETKLRPYIQSPQVDVRVVGFRSKKVYVTGEVGKPGIVPVTDVPMTIMDAINLAGGFDKERADQRTAYLTRNGERRALDILALYSGSQGNLLLQDGDVLYVPNNTQNKVFILGEVEKQQAVLMDQGRLTLADALAGAEGINLSTADTRGIFVIRAVPSVTADGNPGPVQANIYQLDLHDAAALVLADGFQLQPRDLVYVSSSSLVRWNRVIQQILPTITTLFQTDRLIFNR